MTTTRKKVYRQRNALAVGLAKLTLAAGGKAGLGRDDKGFMVLYIDTPAGQVSYHIWDHDFDLIEGLPAYTEKWDGTFRGQDGEWCKWAL